MDLASRNTGAPRVSALQRLGQPANGIDLRQRLSAPVNASVTDARELLANRSRPMFDARQLLSRTSSKSSSSTPMSITVRETDDAAAELNSKSRGHSFADSTAPSVADEKIVISLVNDYYQDEVEKRPSASRTRDAPAHRTHASSSFLSRSPVRLESRRQPNDEPLVQRIPSRKRAMDDDEEEEALANAARSSSKRLSSGVPIRTRPTTGTAKQSTSNSESSTILITNLGASVTEDDVMEVFSRLGRIEDIATLSRGCVQLTYARAVDAERAVDKYHNRLLEGHCVYVSLQQSSSSARKASTNVKETLSSKRIRKNGPSIESTNDDDQPSRSHSNASAFDPNFIRQALFNPSNNRTNPVQFQVKL